MTEKYKQLEQLIGGYFHQDWDIEGENDAEVVTAYLRAITPEKVIATIGEIDLLLEECRAVEGEPENSLRKLGCEYCYQADNLTGSEWLRHIRALLVSDDRVPSAL